MFSAGETQSVNLRTYLEVLSKVPGVTGVPPPGATTDPQTTQRILEKALGDSYSLPVVFERGTVGDGRVQVVRVYRAAEGGPPLPISITFEASGRVYCQATQLDEVLPPNVAPLFLGGLFGGDELTIRGDSAEEFVNFLSYVRQEDNVDDAYAVILKKVEGVRDLYRCAIERGGVANCGEADGFGKFAEAEKLKGTLFAQRQEEARQVAQSEATEQRSLMKKGIPSYRASTVGALAALRDEKPFFIDRFVDAANEAMACMPEIAGTIEEQYCAAQSRLGLVEAMRAYQADYRKDGTCLRTEEREVETDEFDEAGRKGKTKSKTTVCVETYDSPRSFESGDVLNEALGYCRGASSCTLPQSKRFF